MSTNVVHRWFHRIDGSTTSPDYIRYPLKIRDIGYIMTTSIKLYRNDVSGLPGRHLKSFLGLAGYFRKFIKILLCWLCYPEKNPWKWAQEEEEAFQFLKKCLINPPILRYPNFSREFLIHSDASGYGVGSVLSQIHTENGEEKEVVINYNSRHLSDVEKNWSTIEKEA